MLVEIHSEGTFTVILTPGGYYEAYIRIEGSASLRIGRGPTPKDAIGDALSAS